MEQPAADVPAPSTVMGPEGLPSAAELSNGNNPPAFITGRTIKKRYADELRLWIEMMESYSSSEKLKYELRNAGFKIYRRCDEQARDILDEARSNGSLNLKGNNEEDPTRTKLVDQIIKLIATESIPERITRKVALLNEISSCVRSEGETPSSFANRFKSLTAKYSVQIGHIDHNASCRMALMMIQNARLPPSIQSNMVIQLTGNTHKDNKRMKSYVVSKEIVDSFTEYIHQFNKDLDPEEPIFQHEFVDKIKEIAAKEEGDDGFSLKETIEVMAHVTETTDVYRSNTLISRKETDTYSRTKRCHGCGKTGHFARDNPSCFRKMKKKSEEYRKRKAEESEFRRKSEQKREQIEYEPDLSQGEEDKDESTTESPRKKQRKKSFFR